MVPLRLLLIEDSDDDAALIVRTLRKARFDVNATRVDTADDLRDALASHSWDAAIADYTMPDFSGMQALEMVRDAGLDLPFIFVSGTIGEDVAVAAMKQGAHDYIMKGNLARLAPAVERELREAAVRRERTRANERVTYLAYHDSLTDLPNRALLHDRLQQAILRSRRENKPSALLVMDLDGFKEVNDALGHDAGDRVLQQVAARLRQTLRESDTVGRLGGDEFAVVLPITDLGGAEQAARKILNELDRPVVVDDRPLTLRGSIGAASFPLHATTGQALLQKADAAMYLAKANRSGYAVYTTKEGYPTEHRLALMAALRDAVDGEQFALEYQPMLDLRTGMVCGLEALLRWNHPDHGQLQPDDFIRVAENMGLITPLTEFSIARAFSDWSASDAPPLAIAANLSPRSLHDATFPRRIQQLLDSRRVGPERLALEITENVIMSDPDYATRRLHELHEMGVRLSLDDFGTGYSSLSYLRRLPVSELKIDRSFILGMEQGEDDALVRGIVDLAHNLRLRVIAEGVETEEVSDRLRALGCDAAQGFFIRRPGSADEIAAWLGSQRLSA